MWNWDKRLLKIVQVNWNAIHISSAVKCSELNGNRMKWFFSFLSLQSIYEYAWENVYKVQNTNNERCFVTKESLPSWWLVIFHKDASLQ